MVEKSIFLLLLLVSIMCIVGGVLGATYKNIPSAKLANTASALLGLASMLQLRISGWFDGVMRIYSDQARYPYGPPSHVTREIIDNPDHPIRTWLRNALFFDPNFGAYLAVASLLMALAAVWVPSQN